MRRAQAEWKERVADSEEQYNAALKEAAERLKRIKMGRIDSFFKIQFINYWFVSICSWLDSLCVYNILQKPDGFQPIESM